MILFINRAIIVALVLKAIYFGIVAVTRPALWTLVLAGIFVAIELFGRHLERLPYVIRIPVYTLAGFSGFILVIVALVVLVMPTPDPDFSPDVATQTISVRPEFQRVGTEVHVWETRRSGDSAGYYIYTADLSFIPHGSPTPVGAEADFTYKEKRWRVRSLSYRQSGERKTIRFAPD